MEHHIHRILDIASSAIAVGGAPQQVLLRQVNALAGFSLEDEGALRHGHGGEGPAAAALALVLDAGDAASGPPVEGARSGQLHGPECGDFG